MQIILNEQCDMGARQAGKIFLSTLNNIKSFSLGAIYLKNHINTYWSDYNDTKSTTDSDIITLANAVNVNINTLANDNTQKLFVVSDPDKEYLRTVIIDAIIRTKDPLR